MMRSLYSAVSGLKGHQTRMDVIGNNIANINTTGFKYSRVNFSTMLSQTLSSASSAQGNRGGTNSQQVGLGTAIASIDTIITDGSVQSTGNNTDLAISGNGYFVIKDGNQTYYTRDGAFLLDATGNLVTAGGLKVAGWMADSNGTVNSNAEVEDILVPSGQTMAPKATSSIDITKNLSAEAGTGSLTVEMSVALTNATNTPATSSGTFTGGSYTVNSNGQTATITVTYDSLIDYMNAQGLTTTPSKGGTAANTTDATTALGKDSILTATATTAPTSGSITKLEEPSTASTSTIVYDAEGMEHKVYINYKKIADNQWEMTVVPTGSDTINGTSTGTVEFNSDGSFKSSTLVEFSLSPAGGATTPMTISLDFDDSTFTQYSGDTTVKLDPDGYTAGTLSSVSFDSTGSIIGTFSNGLKQTLAQVALATFNNPGGLESAGSNLYTKSKNSGDAQISTANSNGAGTITASALEMSNANLSEQFTDMIVTQRGYQSNSKIITVSDEMLETAINMKR
jgi:flagellar hook protein FlgE